ncbi:conjugative transfer relaxase/helicase TraI domain-containing protein, partial [Kluyvera georgiana]|uniref:conjugative transfer relaxase/helicase TraI domain-containing protein n=1 Tax=Kluyvera georgiana TaxID=73098 RepID=UPI003F66E5DC
RGIVFPGKSFFSAHEVSTCKISGCLSYRILDSGPDGTQTTLTNAGLALVSLIASSNGRLTQGETRMVATEGVQGAILQRSSSGETHVARSLEDALDAVRRHPKDGVVWQTGEVRPSASLLKLTRGTVIPNEEKVAAGIAGIETEIRIPDLTVKADMGPDCQCCRCFLH